jgi:hypothetical protein
MVMKNTLLRLPDITGLRRRAQSLAALDAIMSPDWRYRYYSFNSKWDANEMMASRKNGSGDELYVLFTRFGAILKGFDHESLMSPWARDDRSLWPLIFDGVPAVFEQFLQEPSFDISDTTFCVWRQNGDSSWQLSNIEYPDADESADGSEEQLSLFVGGPELYLEFAKEYFEKRIPLEIVSQIYKHEPITELAVRQLNPEADPQAVYAELLEIEYPSD